MKTILAVLISVVIILIIACFIFYKLWRRNKKLVKVLEADNKDLRYKLDLEKNKKAIFEDVFSKKEKEKKDIRTSENEEDKYHKIMEDFRK